MHVLSKLIFNYRKNTAIDRGLTDRFNLTHDLELDYDFKLKSPAMVMIYSRAKVQGQPSVGSEDRVETKGRTDGQTEAIALSLVLTRSVK